MLRAELAAMRAVVDDLQIGLRATYSLLNGLVQLLVPPAEPDAFVPEADAKPNGSTDEVSSKQPTSEPDAPPAPEYGAPEGTEEAALHLRLTRVHNDEAHLVGFLLV